MVAIRCGMPSYISLPLVDSRTHFDTLNYIFCWKSQKILYDFLSIPPPMLLWIDSSQQRNIPNAWGEIPVDDGVGKEIVRIPQLKGEKKPSNLQRSIAPWTLRQELAIYIFKAVTFYERVQCSGPTNDYQNCCNFNLTFKKLTTCETPTTWSILKYWSHLRTEETKSIYEFVRFKHLNIHTIINHLLIINLHHVYIYIYVCIYDTRYLSCANHVWTIYMVATYM